MATIDSTSLLISLLCFIAVLTSSVNAIARPDGTHSASPTPSQDSPSNSSSVTIGEHPHSDVDDKKISKNNVNTSMMAEGGPIPISTSIQQQANTQTAIEPDVPDETREREKTKERNAAPSVLPRKGVEQQKVKARKGVSQPNLDIEQVTTSTSQTTLENIKPIVEKDIATMAPAHANDRPETSKVDISKSNVTNSQPIDNSDHHSTNSGSISIPVNTSTSYTEAMNGTTMQQQSSSPTGKKHIPKPKPTVTTAGNSGNDEFRMPAHNKSSSPLGKPRKIDYIVPVIITIIALPILGIAIFVLYRRGRDCWDKRHYRRMDFLIDGMYND